jgi:hypothetical protein
LDVTVDSSDRRRASGFLSRQGPETLRWALYEAAKNSSHHASPDHGYYAAVKDQHDGKLAAISMARKIARRCFHVLRAVDPTWSTPRRRKLRSVATVGTAHYSHQGFAVSSFNRRARQHSCWTAWKH